MRLVEITDEEQFHALRGAWNQLLAESASASTFVTWEWMWAWWKAYGSARELCLLAAYDEGGTLRGLAPLRRKTVRRYGQSFPALCFAGDGSNDTDYLDFLLARGHEAAAMSAFRGRLANELKDGTLLLLNEVPAGSTALAGLRELAHSEGLLSRETDVPCATVALPDSWDGYLASLRPRFRTKVRSVLRNAESKPELQFGFCESAEQARAILPDLFELHRRRWATEGKPGVFGWEQKRQFYYALTPLLHERGALRFSWLTWNNRMLACQYGFVHGSTYYHLQEGYEPDCEHWSVGIALRAWSMRAMLGQGIREYDFLAGVGRHKSDWGAEVKNSKQVVLARLTARNLLYADGPSFENKARESVKRALPERVLEIRRARLENGSAVAPDGGGAAPRTWLQDAVARCYYNMGLSTLVRPFREQYELSSLRAGSALRRRTVTSGRILYFHRIDDQRDAFFPAMPVSLFEQEMRFVARHYNVVSLGTLIERLATDEAENLVAITFDDGYADNFHHALPVLRRYGLPATIFLTTGSIDSREPLWFERLAGAVRESGREYIDMELDLPRRFWLRTPQERASANGRIFQMLRRLPDSERQQHLRTILDYLGAEPDLRNRMLTWDQIRAMREHGIDFGGHTVSHPFLSKLTREQALWETGECKRRIEEELQAPAPHFAYPNGREEDFREWNKEVLREVGYQAAVSTLWGLNRRDTDRFELRRGQPWEEDPAVFAYKLDWYQLVNG